MSEPIEFSAVRDAAGHPCMDISVGGNVLSLSISPLGVISWACLVPTIVPSHGVLDDSFMGKALYSLLNEGLEEE